jgi:hypothetical protein
LTTIIERQVVKKAMTNDEWRITNENSNSSSQAPV